MAEAFNKIISYRYNKIEDNKREELDHSIDKVNLMLTKNIRKHHNTAINNAITQIISSDFAKMNLSTNITEEKLVRNFLLYEFEEKGMNIPENQFGLGYTHLVMIIAELIDYMEHYPKEERNSKINLIAIEEPESFMHPQMQQLFIKNINEALKKLIDDKKLKLNSQLIVTTHSSHILNSKIHSGNSFNDICYVYTEKEQACVVNLDDEGIMPDAEGKIAEAERGNTKECEENEKKEKSKDFRFLKKHIKYKVSELFFADAVILVEGFAEETVLPFYLEQKKELEKRYITIFGIGGAHAFLYERLLKKLGVPALIVTDLDIKREKEDFSQIEDLKGKKTTNETIKHFYNQEDISSLPANIQSENIYIAYQQKIGKYYPTSFEEAFILTNASNEILNNVLSFVKPNIYEKVTQQGKNQNTEQSYLWQVKLAKEKERFANELLYALISEENTEKYPVLPEYINSGLEWLIKKLKEGVLHGIAGN